jgi:hypothetical protein
MSQSTSFALPLADPAPGTTWFDARSCVVLGEEGVRQVFVGGRLVGSFGAKDYAERNVMLIAVSEEPKAHLGHIADAFAVSSETLRQLRVLVSREGIEAVTMRKRGGSTGRGLTARDRARVETSLAEGATVEAAWEEIRRRASRATVGRVKKDMDARVASVSSAEPVGEIPLPQTRLDDVVVAATARPDMPAEADVTSDESPASTDANAAPVEGQSATLRSQPVSSARWVQHVGAWLMLAMLHRLGLYDAAGDACADADTRKQLRIALDAFVCALALGEGCVEGVRRLMTPSGPALLRSNRAPSATWVRRVFGAFAGEQSAARLHLAMARRYVREAHAETERDVVVFYVDNHLRPYTGKETIRKGWRMQDKRVRPGVTDVYVHDEGGNPVLRLADATNGSLTTWLPIVAKLLREMVGPEARIVLGFDRGGAFPEQLATLRDKGFELVTYERKPYPLLAPSAFDIAFTHDGESFGASDALTNLGSGHGRVRRVAIRAEDGHQVNLLTVGTLSVSELYAILRGRWVQENGFHHQVHRWGINQLDGRTTVPYDPDAVIPNPARRRLDRNVRLARVTAGLARNELAARAEGDPRRGRWEATLARAIARERELLALRPTTPTHAPLRETELADKLVRHPGAYKMALDSVRIACANAESDLAATLAEAMVLPNEAKKLLANLLRAPGHVVAGKTVITVRLAPAANRSEHEAIASLLARSNRQKLTLPGDPARRTLRFQSQSV